MLLRTWRASVPVGRRRRRSLYDPAVPAAQSPRTRARDIDRSLLCSALDAAYADGQLDGVEHRDRTAAAMSAKTVGELRALVEDLQLDEPLPPLAPRGAVAEYDPGRSLRRWAVGAGVATTVLVAGVIWAVWPATDVAPSAQGGGSSVLAEEGGGVPAIVVSPAALHTPGGLNGLIEAVRAEFGTTLVGDAVVYPDYAVLEMPVPGSPARALSYYYKGGFDEPTNASTRDPDEPLADLSELDVEAVLGLVAGAPESLAVPDPTSRYLIVRDTGGGAEVSVYASNEFGESGFLEAHADGSIIGVHPYEP